ncbi:hypothetical protein GGX14DRAFT_403931 [Mycena pura]|uniref:Uncharacterized protein n=1 Tax=Mycena pura TaxID=153505 RepID=A0AAD6UV99_9AGAR|nr:hypothetical protein GGX14DRAFT_403931 [Mycena pura]
MSSSALATIFLAIFAMLSFVSSAPTLLKRDVFSPPVLYPHAGTIWRVGERHNVTWDLSHAPKHITNNIGMVILVKNHTLLDLDRPLAKNFDIRVARQEITVPDVAPGDNYQILVFGDSGNTGEMFTITK